MTIDNSIPRDNNRAPLFDSDWSVIEKKSITFDGGTTNAIGDHDGTGDPFDIFTVTGNVIARVWGVCTTDLAGGSATVEVGVSGNTAGIIAQTTATDIDENDIWRSATPDAGVVATSNLDENLIGNSLDVIGTVGTANITAGVIDFYCAWFPVSPDGQVEAA